MVINLKIVGTIVEYNPLHNGHAYAISKIKSETNAVAVAKNQNYAHDEIAKISGENVTMEKIKGKGYKASKEFHGHDLVPAYGLDGKYWVSDGEAVYLFDSATNKLTKAKEYNYENIKGIAYFEDGTTVLSDWTPYFVTHVVDPLTQKTTKYPSTLPGKVYKVNVFTKNYQ